jgi:hypothetical protein
MIFINGVAFEKVFCMVWIVSCTAPLHRTYTIVSAERQYVCSTYFDPIIFGIFSGCVKVFFSI